MNNLKEDIQAIGQAMVGCNIACKGINLEPASGILPRCLFFEQSEILSDVGCSVIGINPGKSSKSERSYFVSNGCSYQATFDFWVDHEAKRHLYYNRLRDLVSAVFGGSTSILWTELVKCESADGTGEPPLQTFRTCVNQYLRKEIEATPITWPIFSVGKRSFELLAILYHERTVIGVPHPTGSFGHFSKLFEKGRLKSEVADNIRAILNNSKPIAEWVSV
jgi:hypothetical protein